jgi:hypothetical protein
MGTGAILMAKKYLPIKVTGCDYEKCECKKCCFTFKGPSIKRCSDCKNKDKRPCKIWIEGEF